VRRVNRAGVSVGTEPERGDSGEADDASSGSLCERCNGNGCRYCHGLGVIFRDEERDPDSYMPDDEWPVCPPLYDGR